MDELIKTTPVDQDKLKALIQKKQEMIASKTLLKVKMKQAIYQVMTPKQRANLAGMVGKMRQRCNKN